MQVFITIAVFLIAIIIHEVAHGFVALKMGDPTARDAGRLNFNPVRHVDPVGTVILPALLIVAQSPVVIGWAKPVPVDPRNFNDPRKGVFLTSLAGPASNFIMAVGFSLVFWANILLFNNSVLALFGVIGVAISLILGFFNLIPVPPLDGSGVLSSVLPAGARRKYHKLDRYGFIILIGLLYLGLLDRVLLPLVSVGTRFLTGVRIF